MTLVGAILKKVSSMTSMNSGKYLSPPPEPEKSRQRRKKKPPFQYAHVNPKVDTSPPRYDPARLLRPLLERRNQMLNLYVENMALLAAIKRTHFTRGKVDSRWRRYPPGCKLYYERRVNFYRQTHRDNVALYKRILSTPCRLPPTAALDREWKETRQKIISGAQAKFVLFPPVPQQIMEDSAFAAPPGVKRPRVYLTLGMRNGSVIGALRAELFVDVCPLTCQLFLELLAGDGLGHGYVGTTFFRKVPGLYWSGGDVIYDNGFGCYAQRGRRAPIGAENYHFSHSMPGLLSMRVTRDDEVCGIFNITFKALPQFDLQNIVFGRIIRPCPTYSSIEHLGTALRVSPVVQLAAARQPRQRSWLHGLPNTRIARRPKFIRD